MRCLVTAGPTFEPLDLVRRITNFSTGRLGTLLAAELAARGHSVLLLRGVLSSAPLPPGSVETRAFTSTDDLASRFLELATDEPVALLHAAAVSDFTPGLVFVQDRESGGLRPIVAGKYPTDHGRLMVELKPTPKLLPGLRDWYPKARIVGWKFEVEGGPGDVLQRAEAQLANARSNAVVVNGPAWGAGFGFLRPGNSVEPLRDAAALVARIAGFVDAA
jgi:phosphopantothenoylcysteine synthetase/decarboxylase